MDEARLGDGSGAGSGSVQGVARSTRVRAATSLGMRLCQAPRKDFPCPPIPPRSPRTPGWRRPTRHCGARATTGSSSASAPGSPGPSECRRSSRAWWRSRSPWRCPPLALIAYAGLAVAMPRDDGRALLGGRPERPPRDHRRLGPDRRRTDLPGSRRRVVDARRAGRTGPARRRDRPARGAPPAPRTGSRGRHPLGDGRHDAPRARAGPAAPELGRAALPGARAPAGDGGGRTAPGRRARCRCMPPRPRQPFPPGPASRRSPSTGSRRCSARRWSPWCSAPSAPSTPPRAASRWPSGSARSR